MIALELIMLVASGTAALPTQPQTPPPSERQRRCTIPRCPQDLVNSTLGGVMPNGSLSDDPCLGTHLCVQDVLPGCTNYTGDSDYPWGEMCADAIANFDVNRTQPQNIGSATHPIYYFQPPAASAEQQRQQLAAGLGRYVLYIPPSGQLPISHDAGRYEYFLFQVTAPRPSS
jgi:hypothetical protein